MSFLQCDYLVVGAAGIHGARRGSGTPSLPPPPPSGCHARFVLRRGPSKQRWVELLAASGRIPNDFWSDGVAGGPFGASGLYGVTGSPAKASTSGCCRRSCQRRGTCGQRCVESLITFGIWADVLGGSYVGLGSDDSAGDTCEASKDSGAPSSALFFGCYKLFPLGQGVYSLWKEPL